VWVVSMEEVTHSIRGYMQLPLYLRGDSEFLTIKKEKLLEDNCSKKKNPISSNIVVYGDDE